MLAMAEFFMGYCSGYLNVLQNDVIRNELNKSMILSGMGFITEIFVITVMMNKLLLDKYNLEQLFIISGVFLLFMNIAIII